MVKIRKDGPDVASTALKGGRGAAVRFINFGLIGKGALKARGEEVRKNRLYLFVIQ